MDYSPLMGAAAVMKMAVEMAAVSMEKPSGGTSPSGRVPEQTPVPASGHMAAARTFLVSGFLCSMEDEFPIMEKMYMVHEDDDITPCLQEVKDVDHMDPTTSTTPTSNESDYKGLLTSEGTFKRWCHLPPLHIHEELSSRTTLFQVGGDDAARPSVYTASYTSSPREDAMETRGRKADVTEAWKRRRKRSWTLQAGTSAPDGRNFRPTGTSAPKDRNFRPDAAKMPSSAQRNGSGRNFRPEGPELPPTRNFRPSSAQVPKLRQNAPGCYCKETGHIRN
ncbi:hypothetical protein QYE76_042282 [Lolium multiflorum]|uniref:Uncharacterized protein n=1 Tax=Lolium multiflorum TaxID=4521 RepID=A0AAD8TGM5_LOLMU|nr:hypothetical protein QYE76_042282 [Lolium multiflorum]